MRSGKLGMWVVFACVASMAIAPLAHGDTESAVQGVLKTMSGPNTVDNPRTSTTPEGYLRHIAAPQGNSFQPSAAAKSGDGSDAIAKSFLDEHADAFGIHSSGVSFVTSRVKTENARIYVKLDQLYEGVPVFGAQTIVQMKPGGAIVSVLSDIMRDAPRVYSGELSMSPTFDTTEAKVAASATLETEHPGDSFDTSEPILHLYVPYVLGATGAARLVYIVEVRSLGPGFPSDERILVDANTGEPVLRIPMILDAKNRTIFDAENIPSVDPGTLKRSEGQGPANISDVDDAYDFFGDTYDFYQTEHGRDSINGAGSTMSATVRYCPGSCPFINAFWDGSRMYFGDGIVTDDIVGHELTHGVTQYESSLIYSFESGALNESFSDVWGEFIDLTNGKGNDSPEVRWLEGEDATGFGGAIRDMQDPHAFGDPDTYLGLYWKFGPSDNGGVHSNSGVCNKVCYLLTDGDTFNGIAIDPMGIPTVADLYYECQTNLLGPSSDYPDFGDQMLMAAENIGLSAGEIENVAGALIATEILKSPFLPLRHFRATGRSEDSRVALTWKNPTGGDFTGVDLVRNVTRFPNNNTDGTVIASITNGAESLIDTLGGAAGADRYYGIFPRLGSFPINRPLFARGTIGVDVDYLSESFANGTDLAHSQITFVPTGPVPVSGPAAQRPDVFFNYTTYAAHTASDSKIGPAFDGTLPVAKEDYFLLPMADDGAVGFSTDVPIPFFGRLISNWVLSANGFIAKAADQYETTTLEDHFDKLRISFLFSDLDPRSGGEVWARFLDDRVAITFENVPSFDNDALGQPGQTFGNTVQCEMFYGGQIRFTYLGLTAQRAVVGLSDGNGVPLDVDDVLAGQTADVAESNLDALPQAIPLELQPVPIQFVEPGTVIEFTATALSTQGPPTFSMISLDDLGVTPMDGATLDPVTGEFRWDTAGFPDGAYGMVMCAAAGQFSSCQTIAAFVVTSTVLPSATDLSLTPKSPRDSDDLVASYTYNHPSLPEGPTIIYWFKYDTIIPAYTNQTVLPRGATKPGESWYFQVLPSTIPVGTFAGQNVYLRGEPVLSKGVTIEPDLKVDANGDGKVNSVDVQLVVGGLLGTAGPGIDPDVNGDGKEDASDIQTTINYILEKR